MRGGGVVDKGRRGGVFVTLVSDSGASLTMASVNAVPT